MPPKKTTLNLTFTRRRPAKTIPATTTQSDDSPSSELGPDRVRITTKFSQLLNSQLGEQCELSLHAHLARQLRSDFPNPKFRQEYLSLAYNLLQNLNPEGTVGNEYLYPKVVSGDITPEQLPTLTDQELYPPKWQKIKDKRLREIKVENEQKIATTDIYKCGKCGKRETTFYQLQTRSMDEPTTSFINCVNCGHKWKD